MPEKELELRKEYLPATVSELRKFVLVTRERIKAHKAQISAIDKMGLSKEVYNQKLKEAQYMGRAVLWAEIKMGKLLSNSPELVRGGDQVSNNKKKSYLESINVTKSASHRAQILAGNEESVNESIIEETRKNKIPTVEQALWKIRGAKTIRDREAMVRKGRSYKKELPPVIHSDFYSYCMEEMKPNSVDHILTDPPYTGKDFKLWSNFGEAANRVLKPGGFCICYMGTLFLAEFIVRMVPHLEYYWQVIIAVPGANAKFVSRKIFQCYNLVLVFQKKPIKAQRFMIPDFIESKGGREKELHVWQKALFGVEELLEKFTVPNQLILEPFGGSGTTGVVCMKNKRKCIIIENDKGSVAIIKARLKDTLKELKK